MNLLTFFEDPILSSPAALAQHYEFIDSDFNSRQITLRQLL